MELFELENQRLIIGMLQQELGYLVEISSLGELTHFVLVAVGSVEDSVPETIDKVVVPAVPASAAAAPAAVAVVEAAMAAAEDLAEVMLTFFFFFFFVFCCRCRCCCHFLGRSRGIWRFPG